MKAVSHMERTGVPIDTELHQRLIADWDTLKGDLVAAVDADFGVYECTTFKANRFADFLSARRIAWPKDTRGALRLDDDTFRDQVRRWPELQPLHELRATLSGLRLTGLEVGADGRNRCLLSPFRAVTGRNQPSNTKFIFGPARWMRGLIKPPEGYGLAYIDFSSQEIGIAAALSGDENMAEGYREGDAYLAFAKAAKLAPSNATKQSHQQIRERCKAIVLGINYGMGPDSMAAAAGITPAEAKRTPSTPPGNIPAVLAVDRGHLVSGDADKPHANRIWLASTCWARCKSPLADELAHAVTRSRNATHCGDCGNGGGNRGLRPGT
jgi:DNA polymerase-1